MYGEAVWIFRVFIVSFLLSWWVFNNLELIYDFFELWKWAELKIVANVELIIHEVDELLSIILLFKDLLPEESLFLLFVFVHV